MHNGLGEKNIMHNGLGGKDHYAYWLINHIGFKVKTTIMHNGSKLIEIRSIMHNGAMKLDAIIHNGYFATIMHIG